MRSCSDWEPPATTIVTALLSLSADGLETLEAAVGYKQLCTVALRAAQKHRREHETRAALLDGIGRWEEAAEQIGLSEHVSAGLLVACAFLARESDLAGA